MSENYYIPENPQYVPNIRRIRNDDDVHADDIVNPVLRQMIENTASVKKVFEDQVILNNNMGTALRGLLKRQEAAPSANNTLIWVPTTGTNANVMHFWNGTTWVPTRSVYG